MSEETVADSWEFADKPDAATATSDGREICFSVRGSKPAPCYEVQIVQGAEDIWPPIYYLQWRQEGICAQVITPYEIHQCLPLDGKVDSVTLQYRDGSMTVPVEPRANS
jgi:hypothetical protein